MAARKDNAVDVITQRGRIIGLWEGDMATSDIAAEIGVSLRTVQRWTRRWQEEGSLATKARSGRPRVTTPEQDARMVTLCQNHPKMSAVHITRNLQLPCTPQTTRRRLRANAIGCHVPAHKQQLNQHHKESRLGFALQYLGADPSFREKVIYSDEKCFTSVEAQTRHCWRKSGTRYELQNIQKEPRVDEWVAISGVGCGHMAQGSWWD